VCKTNSKNLEAKVFDQLMEMGKQSFKERNYPRALKHYSEAIEEKPEASLAYLNRSAVNLQLNMYHNAYKDAEKSVQFQKDGKLNEKGYFRMGKAAYSMRQFQVAFDSFTKCVNLNSSNNDALVELKRSEDRLKESTSGVYNQSALIENLKNGLKQMDVADFKSDHIRLVEAKNGGYKGVKAVVPIRKGTLLVVSKAVSIVYANDVKVNEENAVEAEHLEGLLAENTISMNLKKLVEKMKADPGLARQIYSLKCGKIYLSLLK